MPREPLTPDQQRHVSEAMRHIHPAYGPDLPFERIAINQGALCIECKACDRRSAMTSDNCAHIHIGNKTLIKSMKFTCQRCGCGSTETRLYNAHTRAEAEMFLAGDPLPDGRKVK
jgi:hypothetical protein